MVIRRWSLVSILVFIMLAYVSSFAQTNNKYVGSYINDSGVSLVLNEDCTFEYSMFAHFGSVWAKGKWVAVSDTIYFDKIIVYDTVKTASGTDTLVMSDNDKSERISNERWALTSISGGGQLKTDLPKLYFKRKQLYNLANKNRFKKTKRA